jgi:alkaline phosphatase D
MKVAFTSCMSTQVFPGPQPVWTQIAQSNPDQLVLTGDNIYIDAMPNPVHPKHMSDDEFAFHLFSLYQQLLAQPEFSQLVKAVPTDAIWDDHDFLWNESYAEKAIKKNVYKSLVRASRAMFNAYTRALTARLAPGSFPSEHSDFALWAPDEPEPGYRYKDLGQGIALHLTDGRSSRVGNVLLGQAQRLAIEARMASLPVGSVHLLASGSVVEAHKGEHWGTFQDYQWLLALGRRFNVLVLSGDVHENRFAPIDLGGGRALFEATASGAAIRRLITLLSECQNYGMLDIDANQIVVSLFSFGAPSVIAPVRIDRATWTLL